MTVTHTQIMEAIAAKEATDAAWNAGWRWGLVPGAILGAAVVFFSLSL